MAPLGLTMVSEQIDRRRRDGQGAVGARRRRQGRIGADALPGPHHRLCFDPGGLCHGLRVLRHRPGRVRAAPRERARSSPRCLWAVRSTAASGRRLGNVVFMGMGEPLANYDRVWKSIERLHGDVGISARRLTVSTVGIVPAIRRMAAEALPVNLAVSLHAANDRLRDELVPINRRYRLTELIEACRDYLAAKHRRLSFEWAMIDGVNDTDLDAKELASLVRPLRAHVNLIPLNRTPGWPTTGSPPASGTSVPGPPRPAWGSMPPSARTAGTEIAAACGQIGGWPRDRADAQTGPAHPAQSGLIRPVRGQCRASGGSAGKQNGVDDLHEAVGDFDVLLDDLRLALVQARPCLH